MALASIFMLEHVRADIVWETHYADNAVISNNSMLTAGGTTVTFSTTVVSDNDTAEDMTIPDNGRSGFFTIEDGPSGNHAGHIALWFNNVGFDPADYLELSMQFSLPLSALQFSVTDVDASVNNTWGDSVEVFYNGINVRSDQSLFFRQPAVVLDDEDLFDGFEGNANVSSLTSTDGNIDFAFGSVPVNVLTIRYRSTDDKSGNPNGQHIGITDLTFAPVPEPAVGFAGIILALGGYALRRHSRSDPLPKT